MDTQTKIQFAIGAGLVAAGLVIEFTLHTDATRGRRGDRHDRRDLSPASYSGYATALG